MGKLERIKAGWDAFHGARAEADQALCSLVAILVEEEITVRLRERMAESTAEPEVEVTSSYYCEKCDAPFEAKGGLDIMWCPLCSNPTRRNAPGVNAKDVDIE